MAHAAHALAPLLGIELMKETQAQIAHVAALAPAARLPMLLDLLPALDTMEPADRKRLRAIARAFAPTVATGDMLRFAVTRMLEKRLAKAVEAAAAGAAARARRGGVRAVSPRWRNAASAPASRA